MICKLSYMIPKFSFMYDGCLLHSIYRDIYSSTKRSSERLSESLVKKEQGPSGPNINILAISHIFLTVYRHTDMDGGTSTDHLLPHTTFRQNQDYNSHFIERSFSIGVKRVENLSCLTGNSNISSVLFEFPYVNFNLFYFYF